MGSIGWIWDNTPSQTGPPTLSAAIRLADWPEGNYRNSDSQNPSIGVPRGEILIGGPSVSLGYYVPTEKVTSGDLSDHDRDLLKKNKEDFIYTLEDGRRMRWFRTGDIGKISKHGQISIIDRKKDLWKGPAGTCR